MVHIAHDLLSDCRYSTRRLMRSPRLTAFAFVTLTVAITANTAALSVLNALSIRKVVAADPDALIAISSVDSSTGRSGFIYGPTFDAFREIQTSFSKLSLYVSPFLVRARIRDEAVDLKTEGVTGEFFQLVGIEIMSGRGLDARDDGDGSVSRAAVISDALWQMRFGRAGNAIGEALLIEGQPVTVVGVAPSSFNGVSGDTRIDLWLPIAVARSLTTDTPGPIRAPQILARLDSGKTLRSARAEVLNRWPTIQGSSINLLPSAVHQTLKSQRITVNSVAGGFSLLRQQYERPVAGLYALTSIFFVLAVANVVGLLLSRSLSEQHETLMRISLGATRGRLLRQASMEGLILSVPCLAISIPLAWQFSLFLTAMVSATRSMPIDPPLSPDPWVLLTASLCALLGGVITFATPVWHASSRSVSALQERTLGRRMNRSTNAVIVAQVALSLTLLVSGSLFGSTVTSLESNQSHLRGKEVLFSRLSRTPGDRSRLDATYLRHLTSELRSVSGVRHAALSSTFPGYLGAKTPPPTDLYADSSDSRTVSALTEYVSPGFFESFDIPRPRGRDFTWEDTENAPAVAIINQRATEVLALGSNPVGQFVKFGGNTAASVEIVGVVANSAIGSIRDPEAAVIFRPISQSLGRGQTPVAHVRVDGDIASVARAYRDNVERLGHHYVRSLFTLDEYMNIALRQERLLFWITMTLAAIALLLACTGLYAAFAFSVMIRTREMAIRMAVGATPGRVLTRVLWEGLLLVAIGVLVGVPSSLFIANMTRSQLFGVGPADPTVVIACTITLFLLAGVALLRPAWRAASADINEALRDEC